jgi:hypothetical protein
MNMIGQKFGKYIVISDGKIISKSRHWFCRCECGVEKYVQRHSLITGKTKSCRTCCGAHGHVRHGLSSTPEYQTVRRHYRYIFEDFHPKYKWYKGMPFEPDWSFQTGGAIWKGAQWIRENLGLRPTSEHTMDIINRDLGFVKGNLRWATRKEQVYNRRNTVTLEIRLARLSKAAADIGYKLVPI